MNTDTHTVKGERRQFLTFSAGAEEYGADIMHIREIISYTRTTRLPNTPHYMQGVINLRGSVIPVFDLKARLTQGKTDTHDKSVVVIVDVDGRLAGMLVDLVSDMLACSDDDIRPAPKLGDAADDDGCPSYINGVISSGDKMIVLIEPGVLFGNEASLQSADGGTCAA